MFFLLPTDKPPVFGACKRLDIELEMVRVFFSPCDLKTIKIEIGRKE